MSEPIGPSFRFDETQQALADSIEAYCRDRSEAFETAAFAVLWKELAELGVQSLATPDSETGALEVAAVFEALGAGGCGGPLVETLVASQLVPDAQRSTLAEGSAIISVSQGQLVPFAAHTSFIIEIDHPRGAAPQSGGPEAYRCAPRGELETVTMHGGERWGRGLLERGARLGPATAALALADIGVASYLAGAGLQLVRASADYAAKRKQFGRSIGEFQAVAHPLADLHVRFESVRDLSRAAAWHWDASERDRTRSAAARIAASAAALDAAATAHQIHGAVAYSEESAIPAATRRMRNWAQLRPGADSADDALLAGYGLAAR